MISSSKRVLTIILAAAFVKHRTHVQECLLLATNNFSVLHQLLFSGCWLARNNLELESKDRIPASPSKRFVMVISLGAAGWRRSHWDAAQNQRPRRDYQKPTTTDAEEEEVCDNNKKKSFVAGSIEIFVQVNDDEMRNKEMMIIPTSSPSNRPAASSSSSSPPMCVKHTCCYRPIVGHWWCSYYSAPPVVWGDPKNTQSEGLTIL